MQDSLHLVDRKDVEQFLAIKYIGFPWFAGGRGPHEFDCAGLCIHIYKTELGIDIGDDFESPSESWERIESPESLCIVSMKTDNGDSHVGLWFESDRGGVFHAVAGYGVTFTPIEQLKAFRLNISAFYRYKQP